jgi:hypothetical protein
MPMAVLTLAAAIGGSGVAGADPDPLPLPPQPVDASGGVSQQPAPNPSSGVADILTASQAGPAVLGPAPADSAAADPLAPAALLLPQNFGMPTGEQPSPYVLADQPVGPFARIDAFQGAHALLHAALGRMPGDQLGQALPGTAPPPGTALPPGLVQFLPDDPAATPGS